jgi:DNA-binding XRE family transcriptional regulator
MSKKQNFRLTVGESLLLDRRRRGENQKQAAARLELSYNSYCYLERDMMAHDIEVELNSIAPNEKCLIYRKRAGMTQAQVANTLGLCRWWINLMEQGKSPCGQLLQFWEA